MKSFEEYRELFKQELKKGNKKEFCLLLDELLSEYSDINDFEGNGIEKYLAKAIEIENKSRWYYTLFWLLIMDGDYYTIYSYKNKLPTDTEYDFPLELMARAAGVYADYAYVKEILKLLKERNHSDDELNKLYDSVINLKAVETIQIDKFHSLENILLDNLSDKKEIYFLGENGVGKSILLQAILRSLKTIERNYFRHRSFEYKAKLKGNNDFIEYPYANAFAYGVGRLTTSVDNYDNTGYATLFDEGRNVKLTNPVIWLKEINRLEINNVGVLKLENILELLNEVLSISDSDENTKDITVEFDKKEGVVFKEQNTTINFKHLADGYRSILVLLTDLLKRLSEQQPEVTNLKDYKGIVLIDEIDMLLHPKWEYSIVRKIREKFPNIQWFLSTHSPMLILGASEDAVFYRLYKEEGKTKISEPWINKDIVHLMANGLITSPLFDMPTARMKSLKKADKMDTSINYYVGKIHAKIDERLEKEKSNGKVYFSKEEIEKFIEFAIDELKQKKEGQND